MKDTAESITTASYLDCYLCIDKEKFVTMLYEKRDNLNFSHCLLSIFE